jgi:hypothetical protein
MNEETVRRRKLVLQLLEVLEEAGFETKRSQQESIAAYLSVKPSLIQAWRTGWLRVPDQFVPRMEAYLKELTDAPQG